MMRKILLAWPLIASVALAGCQTNDNLPEWWSGGGDPSQTAQGPGFDPTAGPRGQNVPTATAQSDPQPVEPRASATTASPQQPAQAIEIQPLRTNPQITRVALLLPLSGQAATVGGDLLNAAQMALFDFGQRNFEIVPYDTQGNTAGASAAAQKAIGEGAELILGPLLSANAKTVAPLVEAANLQMITFSNDSTASGPHTFVMGLRPEEEVQRVVSFAASRGLNSYALLAPANEYGNRVAAAFGQTVQANGGVVADVVRYAPGTEDFNDIVKRMANYDARRLALEQQRATLSARGDEVSRRALERLENLQTLGDVSFDTLLVAEGGKQLQQIAALLPFYDIDPKKVRILGTTRWEADWVRAEPALVGGWFAAPPAGARSQFEEQYNAVFGKNPHRISTLAYDAVALAAVLASGGRQADFNRTTFADPSGFAGRDGIFRFRPDGLVDRGLAIKQVRTREFREIQPAPGSFQPAIN